MAKGAMEWLQDALDCTTGEHGDWWRDRYDQAMEDGLEHWWQWRDIRQNERAPGGRAVNRQEVIFGARHIGDSDETVTGDLAAARELAYFNTGAEVVVLGDGFGPAWSRFYGPEVAGL